MNAATLKALEAAGFAHGDAEDFLELSEEERLEVDLRIRLGRTIRRLREANGLTRRQLARKLKATVAHVGDVELGTGVTLDAMFRALFALRGTLESVVNGKPEIILGEEVLATRGSRRKKSG